MAGASRCGHCGEPLRGSCAGCGRAPLLADRACRGCGELFPLPHPDRAPDPAPATLVNLLAFVHPLEARAWAGLVESAGVGALVRLELPPEAEPAPVPGEGDEPPPFWPAALVRAARERGALLPALALVPGGGILGGAGTLALGRDLLAALPGRERDFFLATLAYPYLVGLDRLLRRVDAPIPWTGAARVGRDEAADWVRPFRFSADRFGLVLGARDPAVALRALLKVAIVVEGRGTGLERLARLDPGRGFEGVGPAFDGLPRGLERAWELFAYSRAPAFASLLALAGEGPELPAAPTTVAARVVEPPVPGLAGRLPPGRALFYLSGFANQLVIATATGRERRSLAPTVKLPLRLVVGARQDAWIQDGEPGALVHLGFDGTVIARVPCPVAALGAMALDRVGRLYLGDRSRGRIAVLGPDGSELSTLGLRLEPALGGVTGLAVRPDGEGLWVADRAGARLIRVDSAGLPVRILTGGTAGLPLAGPEDLAATGDGGVWAVDAPASRLVRFDPEGRLVASLPVPGGDLGGARIRVREDGGLWLLDPSRGALRAWGATLKPEPGLDALLVEGDRYGYAADLGLGEAPPGAAAEDTQTGPGESEALCARSI